jgi:hypothetical protein
LTAHRDHLSAFNEQIMTLTALFEGDKKIILLGDFNLDQLKRNDPTYHHYRLYETWKAFETEQQLLQHRVSACKMRNAVKALSCLPPPLAVLR